MNTLFYYSDRMVSTLFLFQLIDRVRSSTPFIFGSEAENHSEQEYYCIPVIVFIPYALVHPGNRRLCIPHALDRFYEHCH